MIRIINTSRFISSTYWKAGVNLVSGNTTIGLRRRYSSEVEDLRNATDFNEIDLSALTTGVLAEKSNEIIFFYTNIYPIQYTWLSRLLNISFKNRLNDNLRKERMLELSSTEKNPFPEGTSLVDFVPLTRDGGAFVKYELPSGTSSKDLHVLIRKNLKEYELNSRSNIFKYIASIFVNTTPRCHVVNGTPWVEDLNRFPSNQVKVEFEGKPLTEEELYVLFRRYGVIQDITPYSSSTNQAKLNFRSLRSAIFAKNCMTGLSLNSGKTVIHLKYIPFKRVNYIQDFIVNHQRISIPAILALLATIAVLIFDPIRDKSMQLKVTQRFSFNSYKENSYFRAIYEPYKYLLNWINNGYDYLDEKLTRRCDRFNENGEKVSVSDLDEPSMLWSERFEKAKQLKLWICENVNTFIVVRGPKGSGKQEFVFDYSLNDDTKITNKILHISCESLINSRSDSDLIKTAAYQLGYFPVFTWLNSISQFIDLGVQSITGQKSGLSESKETQIKNMFSLASQSLRKVALSDYHVYRARAIKERNKKNRTNADTSGLEDEIMKEDEFLQQNPNAKPIVVINKFGGKSGQNAFIYKMLSDWSSQLIQSNTAHVIFITNDVGSVSQLTDALPNQVFKTINLSDASQKSSKQYLLTQLKNNLPNNDALDFCLVPLGGRMLDLQSFVRRIKSGETFDEALNEMVNQAAEQITTFFLNNSESKTSENNWNSGQVWELMKILSKQESIDYNDLVKSPLFKSSGKTLETLATLEKHDFISLTRDRGIVSQIATGRPIFKAAFKNLINDIDIYKVFEPDYLTDLLNVENMKIAKLEEELTKIGSLKNLKGRMEYIQDKIEASNKKIIQYELKIKEIAELKREKSFMGIKY